MRLKFTGDEIKRLCRVALGREPADLILNNGRVLNVYTGEVLRQQILTASGRIAYVGPHCDFPLGPDTGVVDLDGQVVIPGLIDGHIHMDAWVSVGEFVRMSLPGGTTTIITEIGPSASAMGVEGVKAFLRQCRNLPQRFFALAPSIVYLCSYKGEGQRAIDTRGMLELLDMPEILGLGEIYWPHLLQDDPDDNLINLMAEAIARGKTIEGHSAGARKQKLAALVAMGIDACHEPITADEVRERLRLGLSTMIREGAVRRELKEVVGPLTEMKVDLRRAVLVSDGIWPGDLIKHGHMDNIVQKAIDLGVDPVEAVRMSTLNVAEHFHLSGDLGSIAPGKCADMVVVPDLKTIKALLVVCRGQVVARDGSLTMDTAAIEYPKEAYKCLNLPRVEPGFFSIAAIGPEARVRSIQMVTSIVNREAVLTLPVVNGLVSTNGGAGDVVKAAVLDKYRENGSAALGFITGSGLKEGALAASFSFDENNLVVIGCNDRDMALAVNRVREIKGGIVYCCRGQVLEEIPMPIFGAVSELSGAEVAARMESLERFLKQSGWVHDNPLLTVFTITFTAIPSIRLLSRGYWLSKENRVVDLFSED